jgi:hypothetical protein
MARSLFSLQHKWEGNLLEYSNLLFINKLLFILEESMAIAQPDVPPEQGDDDALSEDTKADKFLMDFFAKMTPRKLQKLSKLVEDDDEPPSPTMEALKSVSPGFKGRFSDFKLEQQAYDDFMKGLPDVPEELNTASIIPVTRHMAKDAADVRAMDESLMEISRNLKSAMGYAIVALDEAGPLMYPDVGECMFRCLALTANAFARLQIERHTTPALRKTVTDSETNDQLPKVIQLARKAFFRTGAGAKSSSHPKQSDDDDDEGDPPMRKKKRDIFRETRRSYSAESRGGRPRQFNFQGRRAFGSPQSDRRRETNREAQKARAPRPGAGPPAPT